MTQPIACRLETDHLCLELDSTGCLTALIDRQSGANHLAFDLPAPLLRLIIDGNLLAPERLAWDEENGTLTVSFEQRRRSVRIAVWLRPTHIGFELASLVGDSIDAVLWGPIATTIGASVGETVGVARSAQWAVGIQALTLQTAGGFPEEYPDSGFGDPLHAAAVTPFGAVLQAYSRERDGGVVGSRVALFGCRAQDALMTIGQIEVDEGLPHPLLDGEWGKVSQTARQSYLITDFGEATLEETIAFTRQAGFTYFYHEDPFRTWGHFELKPDAFPDGDDSLHRCVERADQAGLRVGIHTLSNFITTNDSYITPTPDPRLMRSGTSQLTEPVTARDSELPIADPEPFRDQGTLSTVAIGEELIQYRGVSDTAPWVLLGCRRGAFGTAVADHAQQAEVGKLADHPYRVFFPDLALLDELADRLIDLFNTTGLRQISFDGLEGCGYTGHGMYAHHRFVERCYRGWSGEILNDASRLIHSLWHTHTRMNWGEPWGKAAREGMPEYRFRNQPYFERNLFPRMLGWFQLRLASDDLTATTLDDIEWTLARCAGFDAGFALSAKLDALRGNGQTETLLNAIRIWESARLANAFTDEQRERLRNSDREFHLEAERVNRWRLYEVAFSPVLAYKAVERQPGEPVGETGTWQKPFQPQPVRIVLRAQSSGSGRIIQPAVTFNFDEIVFPVTLESGQYLIYDGDTVYRVCDENWNTIHAGELAEQLPQVQTGAMTVQITCDERSRGRLEARLMVRDEGEPIARNA